VDVSEGFDVTVVAVGVESSEQLEWLRAAGCHEAQGYLLGPPTPMEKFFKRYIL
jgi:EAL domain-containing protein (putative c-di-GMP-specific phosphodiesterase class I)